MFQQITSMSICKSARSLRRSEQNIVTRNRRLNYRQSLRGDWKRGSGKRGTRIHVWETTE